MTKYDERAGFRTVFRYVLLLSVLLGMVSCSRTEVSHPIQLLDDAQLLREETSESLRTMTYPKGFCFVVRTVKKLDPVYAGIEADDLFKSDTTRMAVPKEFKKKGVYVLLSEEPLLVQVRVGDKIRSLAEWSGIVRGPEYMKRQSVSSPEKSDATLIAMVSWLAQTLPDATQLSGLKKWIYANWAGIITDELAKLSVPSGSFYGHYLLGPIIRARVLESRLWHGWWITYVILAILAYFAARALQGAVNLALGAVLGWIGVLISLIFGILAKSVVAISSAASMVLLSGSRVEDVLALKGCGIPLEGFSFSGDSYLCSTGLGIALLLLLARFLKGFIDVKEYFPLARMPEAEQIEVFESYLDKRPAEVAKIMLALGREVVHQVDAETPEEHQLDMNSPFSAYKQAILRATTRSCIAWFLIGWFFLPQALSVIALLFMLPPVAFAFLSAFAKRIRPVTVTRSESGKAVSSMATARRVRSTLTAAVIAVLILAAAGLLYSKRTGVRLWVRIALEGADRTKTKQEQAVPGGAARGSAAQPDAVARDAQDALSAALRAGSTRQFLMEAAPAKRAAWERSANAGSKEAQWLMGCCHEHGISRPKDPKAAFEWYRRSAEQGYAPAENDVGLCYLNGNGVVKDPQTAVKWFRQAAGKGRPSAQYNLAVCCEQGIGVTRDVAKAVEMYQKAAQQGYGPAVKMLERKRGK